MILLADDDCGTVEGNFCNRWGNVAICLANGS
jgi:hypothetical protein